MAQKQEIIKKLKVRFLDKDRVKKIAEFIYKNAERIEQSAFEHHTALMDTHTHSVERMKLIRNDHVRGIRYLAQCIEGPQQCIQGFRELGKEFADIARGLDLSLEEAVDGTIFMKEALWDEVDRFSLTRGLSSEDLRGLTYIVGVYHDTLISSLSFTYHRKYTEEMEKKMKEREKLNQQLNMFIRIVSHEFRTPLMTVSARLALLERHLREVNDREGLALFEKARSNYQKLENTIYNLFDMSKIETGKLDIKKVSFHLPTFLSKTIEDIRLTTRDHPVMLMSCPDITIVSDKDRLDQILMNLLKNAIKFSPQNEPVEVWCEKEENTVHIHVRDRGRGIPKKEQESIFKPFFQVWSSRRNGGLGLGLYISKNIARALGGDITVESGEGKGSVFRLSFPVTK